MKRRVRIKDPRSQGCAVAGFIESSVHLLERLRPHRDEWTDLGNLYRSVQEGLQKALESAGKLIPDEERAEASSQLQAAILVSRSLFDRTHLQELIIQLKNKQ